MPAHRKDAAAPCPPHRRAYEAMIKRYDARIGPTIRPLFEKGGAEMLEWLAASTPAGFTIMDTVACICIDAYNEEKEQNDG